MPATSSLIPSGSAFFFPSEIGAGTYRAGVELPALWLAPGVYTVHFKLIGVRPSGREEKQHSERCVIEITGGADGIGRASLAPPLRWSIERGRSAGAAVIEHEHVCGP